VLAARQASAAAITVAAGVWADRLPRHLVLVAAATVQGVVQAVTAALILSGHATVWSLALLALAFGLADGFVIPTSQGLIPAIVSSTRLQQANALLGLSRSVVSVLGPAVGGLLVAVGSPGGALLVDAASFGLAAVLLLAIFAVALRFQVAEFEGRPMSPFVRYQVESGMLMVGLYTCDLLAVVMTILTSIDTLAGEISSGTIHAIATKPIARWQILAGKFLGFAAMVTVYVAITFWSTVAVAFAVTGVLPEHPVHGMVLIVVECLVALSVTFLLGTRFSTLTCGVLALGLEGVAFMGGWLEQVSGFSQSTQIVRLGVL